mmetsp:Transcript_33019/g.42443  ORF Transcript_33019/g.42443 Transcript_33019/m.42443 type:complete len:109 (+) Transcript_33019:818-1144(+)
MEISFVIRLSETKRRKEEQVHPHHHPHHQVRVQQSQIKRRKARMSRSSTKKRMKTRDKWRLLNYLGEHATKDPLYFKILFATWVPPYFAHATFKRGNFLGSFSFVTFF